MLLILTMFMGLTGYLLVWDQKAYWATVVAVNITSSAPILGPYVGDILRVGPRVRARHAVALLLDTHAPDTRGHRDVHRAPPLPRHEARDRGAALLQAATDVEREEEDARRRAARERASITRGRTAVPAGPDGAPAPTRAEAGA